MALDINLIKADVEIREYYESPYASILKHLIGLQQRAER